MSLDSDLRTLAEQQYGVVSRRQARALGARPSGLASRLAGPDWDAPAGRVLRLVGSSRSIRQQLLIAVLDTAPDSALSHGSAAALWQLPGFAFGVTEVSRPRTRAPLRSAVAVVHRPTLLPAAHLTERHGIPVTTLPRTLFDVAATIHPGRLARAVETVTTKSPPLLAALHDMLDDLGASGRTGIAAMRAVLARRPVGYVAPASGLEARFARILTEAGEPPLDRQVDVGGHEWVGRVDFVDRRLGILVEVDSDLHHTSLLDQANDRRRDESLLAAGWRAVVRVTEDEVWRRPHQAVNRVRAARREATRVLGMETHAPA